MLKYLIVQLDDGSVSFCHYPAKKGERRLIDLVTLHEGLVWAMKENLMVQFVYPDYDLSPEYLEVIDTVDHIDIKPGALDADVHVYDGMEAVLASDPGPDANIVVRVTGKELYDGVERLKEIVGRYPSVNVVITDVDKFTDADFDAYKAALAKLSDHVEQEIADGHPVGVNLLTPRLFIRQMDNCNAGVESITLAPDGNFYICPAFYGDGCTPVGTPRDGLEIPNGHLYRLEYAPICRVCDAYHCRRCVWLNRRTTFEVNTPGHEQCVVAHLERNASKSISDNLIKAGKLSAKMSIPEVDYLDPFEKVKK